MIALDLSRFFASMGGTSREVADWLRIREIRGRRGAAYNCPIARALTYHYPPSGRGGAAVGQGMAHVTVGGERHSVLMPPAVCAFVAEFDASEFPDLVGL